MARPVRCRRICSEPEYESFAPCGMEGAEAVQLSVDEFEAVRLIDHEKRTHEQCASQMGISRTTVTEMYERARSKIADCIVNGKTLCISGGNYVLCDGSFEKCCDRKCRKRKHAAAKKAVGGKEAEMKKIAVTYENGDVFQHFGHTQQFKVYDIEDDRIAGEQVISTQGSGHGALAGLLCDLHADTLICGGIGAGAQTALAQAGIQLYGGVSGSADEAVSALLAGNLQFQPDVCCSHHGHHGEGHHCGHEEGHHCGHGEGHHCGQDKHGCAGNC